MERLKPFILISFKDSKEFRCPKGCCYEGYSSSILNIAIFDNVRDAAQHIAKLEFGVEEAAKQYRSYDCSFSHRVISPVDLNDIIGVVWDDIDSITGDKSDSLLNEIKLLSYEFKYELEAEFKAKKDKEAAEKAEQERLEKEKEVEEAARAEREHYEALKNKYEGH